MWSKAWWARALDSANLLTKRKENLFLRYLDPEETLVDRSPEFPYRFLSKEKNSARCLKRWNTDFIRKRKIFHDSISREIYRTEWHWKKYIYIFDRFKNFNVSSCNQDLLSLFSYGSVLCLLWNELTCKTRGGNSRYPISKLNKIAPPRPNVFCSPPFLASYTVKIKMNENFEEVKVHPEYRSFDKSRMKQPFSNPTRTIPSFPATIGLLFSTLSPIRCSMAFYVSIDLTGRSCVRGRFGRGQIARETEKLITTDRLIPPMDDGEEHLERKRNIQFSCTNQAWKFYWRDSSSSWIVFRVNFKQFLWNWSFTINRFSTPTI